MKISLYTGETSNSISTKSALDWEATIITILLTDAQVEDSGNLILQERCGKLTVSYRKKPEIAGTWTVFRPEIIGKSSALNRPFLGWLVRSRREFLRTLNIFRGREDSRIGGWWCKCPKKC